MWIILVGWPSFLYNRIKVRWRLICKKMSHAHLHSQTSRDNVQKWIYAHFSAGRAAKMSKRSINWRNYSEICQKLEHMRNFKAERHRK